MGKVADEHPELFHYTDYVGLKGIIESQNLRATHYACLNDEEEIFCFSRTLKNYSVPSVMELIEKLKTKKIIDEKKLSKICPTGNAASVIAEEIIRLLYDALLKERFAIPFITSFCSADPQGYEAKNGLLSQWNRYGMNGGYALVFDTQKIEELLRREAETFAYARLEIGDVVYSGDERALHKELPGQLTVLSGLICNLVEKRIRNMKLGDEITTGILGAFLQCISLYKHQGFKEEKEVRITAFRLNEKTLEKVEPSKRRPLRAVKVFNSEAKRKDIQYLELFEGLGASNVLPMKKIIIGPSRDKNARAEEVKRFLGKREIEVTVSETPFV